MWFRQFRIPIPEDFATGDPEHSYQFPVLHRLQVAIQTDRNARCAVMWAAFLAGAEDAGTQRTSYRMSINTLRGLHPYQINTIASEMDILRDHREAFVDLMRKLYRCYIDSDAERVEIHPLLITGHGQLLAAGGSLVIDENALYRQPELAARRDLTQEATPERLAREAGLLCITMPGQVGCLVNGAGLAMTTMDLIQHYGQEAGIGAANFVEIDSSDSPEQIAAALRISLSDLQVRAMLVNIFGGITRCDDVAAGIVLACREVAPTVPLIIRLQGTNAAEARRILEAAHLPDATFADTLGEAARLAVLAVKRTNDYAHPR
ncbi:MAG: succinate--CoA ligase subunit beta [Anaerolineae bacterium]|jgi:succinyl-CoA synthetase beta subunit|nr:succinate--CoA ligase subunit beta [Anaerolineae bacterium]